MNTHLLRLITIVAEPVLEERITRELCDLGASGFTVTAAHGAGSRGMRATDPPGESVRIETVVGEEVADRVLEHIARRYFPNYAVIAFETEVRVVRGDKYV